MTAHRFTVWFLLLLLSVSASGNESVCSLLEKLSTSRRELASFPVQNAFRFVRDKILDSKLGQTILSYPDRWSRSLHEAQEIEKIYQELVGLARTHDENVDAKKYPELQLLADTDNKEIEDRIAQLAPVLRDRLLARLDPNHRSKVTTLEIEIPKGGSHTVAFAEMLKKLYVETAQKKGWLVEPMIEYNSAGEPASMILEISGNGAYAFFKHERGRHRLEFRGVRDKTFTNEVKVLVHPEIVIASDKVAIPESDLTIERYAKSSGPGGQNVNKVATAVRMIHKPTGITVDIAVERTQGRNESIARKILTQRVQEFEAAQALARQNASRARQGSRANVRELPRVRTYDQHEHRVTDDRTGEKINLSQLNPEALENFYPENENLYLAAQIRGAGSN